MGRIYRLCEEFKYIFLIRLISLLHDSQSKANILLLGSADGPGTVYFTGLVGHHGAFPCRIFCGMKGRHKPGGPHYYPVEVSIKWPCCGKRYRVVGWGMGFGLSVAERSCR